MKSFHKLSFRAIALVGGVEENVRMMDANRDGFLTKDEIAAGHAQMMKKPSR